jgi:membrane-associated protein
MSDLLDLFLHLDRKLDPLIQRYGPETYLILAAAIFCQTGVIVTPFLPGDSLLFAVGIFCHPDKSHLNIWLMFAALMVAALLGNSFNYFVGKFFGVELFRKESSKIFKKSHLDTTHQAFEKHGKFAMTLAPFVPIVRTFAPFAAGLAKMPFGTFLTYGMGGMTLWIGLFLFGGYFIGSIKVVQENFGVAVIVILVVTAAPLLWETWKAYRESKAAKLSKVEE